MATSIDDNAADRNLANRNIRLIKLDYTSLDINEISDFLSFHWPSYFSTAFKKITGYTPLEYRQQLEKSSS